MKELVGQVLASEAGVGECATLTALLYAAAQRFPSNVAIQHGETVLTYAELVQRAEKVAKALRQRGVGPNVRVGLCAERSSDLIVGLVGILRAGGAYVPLDPTYPSDRLAFILEDAGIELVVATDAGAEALAACAAATPEILKLAALVHGPAKRSPSRAANPVLPGDAAYVIYTSGSTGKPKGVVVTHHNVCRLLRQTEQWFAFGPTDVWTLFHSFAFDFSVWEIWGALAYGGRLVVVPYETSRTPEDFYRLLATLGVTVLNQTPSAFRRLSAVAQALPDVRADALRVVVFGGEALDFRTLEPWLSVYSLGAPRLVNMYGITETTVHVTYHEIAEADLAGGRSLIGQPIPDLTLHVLDAERQPAPVGEPGELYVGGEGVARGYLNRPELTAERFLADPFSDDPEARLYRTGDLARRLCDGNVEYLGRIDDQVKVRGFRIELGEIEAALIEHPAIRESAVVARDDGADEKRLVAYLVAAAEAPQPSTTELRRRLGERLPDYMLPSAFVWLDALPLTSNGKVDRRALPEPARERPTLEQPYAAPRGAFERFVAERWSQLIGVDRVGRHDRFFELGGTSLLAMRFLEACRSERGFHLSVAEFFDAPTVANIARIAASREAASAATPTTPAAPKASDDRIAIVGLAGRFAGAPNVSRFWEMILDGRSGRVEVTAADLEAAGEDPALLQDPDYVAAAFPLDEAESFDAAFFGFTPREAELMDPQQRVLLEAAWTALEDAGIDPRRGASRVGVFAGVGRNAYLLNNLMSHPALRATAADYNMLIGNERDFPSTHIAYRLGLTGPALTVQTGCSTSGVAIHMAAESLRRGECDLALAGGAKVLAPNRVGYRYVEGGPLSPDGFIRAFDQGAGGMVRGSGVAMVALKRLDEALADGDHVYAVLIGSALNNDGDNKAGFTAPSVSGQAAVIAEAYEKAGVSADTVTMIEAHGTGTVLGDPIEVEGLTRAFRATTAGEAFCALGSVKTNIGHLDAGATAAGLVKAALALANEVIPPSLNFARPNPRIGFRGSPFYVADKPVAWKRGKTPRRAGISSFGLGGTNAHILIEEAPSRAPSEPAQGPQLLVLSARTETALARRCADLADWLERHADANLADVAHTLRVGRRRFEKRAAVVCRDAAEAVAKLRRMTPGEVLRGGHAAEAPPVAFMFPGVGSQYFGMARDLYGAYPEFRRVLDACSAIYQARHGVSLVEAMQQGEAAFAKAAVGLPALFAVEYAMASLWRSWGVEPDAMIGHSMGEYAAACLAGVFSLEDAITIVEVRGRLFDGLPPGAMISVQLTPEALRVRLPAELSLAAINRDDLCVVSGPVAAAEAFAAMLDAEGVATRRLNAPAALHSHMLDPILDEFREAVRRLSLHRPQLRFLSSLTGDWITDEAATDPEYWVRHLRQTVLFSDGVAKLLEDSERILIEIGPGQTLATLTRQNARRGVGHEIIATLRHPQEAAADTDFLLGAVARFWLAGGTLDDAAFAGAPRRRTPLPTYPFEHTRYWIDPIPETAMATGQGLLAAPTTAAAPVEGAVAVTAAAEVIPATRRERILAQLTAIICRLSGLPAERIDPHATFLELGFDSLFLTQANAAFRKAFNVRLTTRQLIEATPVLDALAGHLDETLPADAVIGGDEAAAPPRAGAAAPVRAEDSPGLPTVRKAVAAELTPEQESFIDELIATTNRRTPKAKAQTQASRGVLADPRTVQGFRARWKEMVYPVLSDRALGARVWDVDGNEYIDLVGGYGVSLFGHQPPFVVEAIREQIDRTLAIGPQTVLAGEVARLVSDMTGMERVAFCNTGSEAVLAAVRMARTVTGKSKIAKFDGHYHGIFDEMQVRGSGAGSRKSVMPSAPGITAEAISNTLILEYGDPDAFEVLRENADDLALVLVEPVRSRNPDYQPREYLHELRRVTQELGVPLLFDEMITGFRSHPGGAQAIFGVRADIATYGKVAGGGMPIGIVAGSAQFMDTLDGGMWSYGDASSPPADMTWFAGTFVRHPLALAAAKATLEHMKREGPALQEQLNARSARLAADLNAFLRRARTPFKVEQFASFLRVTFTQHQEYSDLLFFELRNRGILTYEGRPIFLTTAHSDDDLRAVRDAFVASVRKLLAVGLLDGRDPDALRRIPMATGQQEIWLTAQFSPEASCAYNLCSTLRLTGDFDPEMFRAALDDLTERHEALRTTPDRDGLTQTIRPAIEAPLVFEDLRARPEADRAARIAELERAEVTTPFDLENGPLIRCKVVRLKDDEHLVMLTVHHVVADGWSCGVLMRDLGELYGARKENRAPALEPAQQLGDYLAFLATPEQREAQAEALAYWRGLYSGDDLKPVEFPSDRIRPKARDFAARRLAMRLAPEVVADLRRVARDNGTTLFASLIGGFAAYVTRLTGVADNPVGFSAAGQPLLGGKSLVGHCVNFLPLRLSTDLNAGFGAHLRIIGATILDALEHQSLDFLAFVQAIQPNRHADWAPLVSLGVNLDPSSQGVAFADLQAEAGSVGRAFENLDLFVNFVETDADVELQCTFNTSLFDEATVRRRMEEYLRLLAAGGADPEAPLATLELVGEDDRRRLLTVWNGEDRLYPCEAGLADLFRAVARKHAQRTALVVPRSPDEAIPSRRVAYADLDRMSDRWAASLRKAGIGPGDFVSLMLPRSLELIVAMLATLKAGAAYVPVTPSTPAAAILRILEHSQAKAVMTVGAFPPVAIPEGLPVLRMDEGQPELTGDGLPAPAAGGGDPAYVLYTSGSTGAPKGVVVPQRGVSRLVLETDFTPLDETRTLFLLAPISFDISMFEIWGALLNGGTLVVPPWEQTPELARFGEVIKATGVTTLQMTPALFNTIIDEDPQILSGVEELMVGGEAMSVSHTHRALKLLPKTNLINVYGPTENSVWSTFYRVPRDFDPHSPSVPIGRPIRNSQAYVVDERMQLAPPGVLGELVVGGDGVAIEYLNAPELTARQFVPDTISGRPGARLYRTGDVCRQLPDGGFEFLGRRDNQVKIRGYRIELGEVEAALQEIAGVSQAVAAHEPGADGGRLVAFVVLSDPNVTPDDMLRALRERLPKHVVPASVRPVAEFPLSAHGKVDRKALLAAAGAGEDAVQEAVAPRTEVERELARMWSELLQRPVASIDDGFFHLGGHSLMAVRLFDRIRRRFGADLPISTAFTHPTIRDLAALVGEAQTGASATTIDPAAEWDTSTVIHPGPGNEAPPIFFVSGLGGNVNELGHLAGLLGRKRRVVAFQARGILGHDPRETIEEMAAEHLRYLRRHQPTGPYVLAGYSAGALTAFEMARQLTARGEQVAELVLLDTQAPGVGVADDRDSSGLPVDLTLGERLAYEARMLIASGPASLATRVSVRLRSILRRRRRAHMAKASPALARSRRVATAWMAAANNYKGGPYAGPASLVLSRKTGLREQKFVETYPWLGWDAVIEPASLTRKAIAASHHEMICGAEAEILVEFIEERIPD